MSFSRYIVKRCYALEDSTGYKQSKQFFFDLIENPRSKIRPYFDIFMILLVITSVFMLIYEVKADLGSISVVFEAIAVTIFITEYLLRLWLYNDVHKIIISDYEKAEFIGLPYKLGPSIREIISKKWDYATTPLAVIDLLAIIPSYRPLRFLRIFLLFRLFKLFRYARSINEFAKVISEKRFELYTLAIFLAFVVFTSASAIYFFEARNQGGEIEHFFDGIYWALVTISTVGYGDITPQTTEGRVITLILIICGIGVLSFTTSVIVSAFTEKMRDLRENRVYAELEKKKSLHTIICGFGRVGQEVAQRLSADRDHFVVIDTDATNVDRAKRLGYLVIEGSAERTQLLENAGIKDKAERILCLTGNDVANVYITLTARYLNPSIEIISRANREETVKKLIQAGANRTVSPFSIVGLIAGEYVGQPVAFEAIYGMLSRKGGIGLEAVVVPPESELDGVAIGDINFRSSRLILFGVISHVRQDEAKRSAYPLRDRHLYFNPTADYILQENDLLIMFGHQYSIVHFKDLMEKGVLLRGADGDK